MKVLRASIAFQEVPGEVSLALEITGCGRHCPGCHSPELQNPLLGDVLTPAALYHLIRQKGKFATCILFMGGDQFPEELQGLLERARNIGYKTALYTGSDYVPLHLLKALDYVKVGNYQEERGALRSPMTNQRFYQIKDHQLVDRTSELFW